MIQAFALLRGDPPPALFFAFFPLLWCAVSALASLFLGIFGLYRRYPADPMDPIEESFWWKTVEFGARRGHAPMNLRFGRRALHMKEPFPFQPLFWLGPASIPWSEISVVQRRNETWWSFWSAASFKLGDTGRVIRVRGSLAKALQARVEGDPGGRPQPIQPR